MSLRCTIRAFTALLFVLFLWVACDSTTDTPDGATAYPIAMSAQTGQAESRSAGDGELDNTALQAQGFGVYAWYTGNALFTNPVASESRPASEPYLLLMRNQHIVYEASASQPAAWTYTPAKYWPLNDEEHLTFRAYAPYTPYIYTSEADGLPRLPVIVAASDYRAGTQHDPLFGTDKDGALYTDIVRPFKERDYLAGEHPDDSRPWTNTVHWYFNHGMAKLLLQGMLANDFNGGEGFFLRVTRISLAPLYQQGLLDIANSTAASASDKPRWEERGGDIEVVLQDDAAQGVTIDPSSDLKDVDLSGWSTYQNLLTDNHGLLIIPRNYTAPGQPLTITVTYMTPKGEDNVTATISQEFLGNTVYTLKMAFEPSSRTVTVELNVNPNWQTGSYNLIDNL